MDIRQLLFAEEPPPPQPLGFRMSRLLITGLIAGTAAATQIVDLPLNAELMKVYHWVVGAPAHPGKPPSFIATNGQGGGALPSDVSSSEDSPPPTHLAAASAAPDSDSAAPIPDDQDDNIFAALPWGAIGGGVAFFALVWTFKRHGLAAWRQYVRGANVARTGHELRREPRRRTRLRRGKLFDVETRSWIECSICDRSATGARIRMEQTLKEFYSFRLFVDEGEQKTYQARVAWCRGNEAGLEFQKTYPASTHGKSGAARLRG